MQDRLPGSLTFLSESDSCFGLLHRRSQTFRPIDIRNGLKSTDTTFMLGTPIQLETPMRFLLSVTVAIPLLFADTAQADFLKYVFSGVLPDGASQHSQISDGETWFAEFTIDSNAADIDPSPNAGFYQGNVQAGSIAFSGGYSQQLDVEDWFTIVFDDSAFEGQIVDAISVRNFQGSNPFPLVQAFVVVPEPVNPLFDSDSLLPVGTSFTSSGNVVEPAFLFQLRFEDQITGEVVEYNSDLGVNVSFNAFAVPEPSAAVLLLLTGSLLIVRRYRGHTKAQEPVWQPENLTG